MVKHVTLQSKRSSWDRPRQRYASVCRFIAVFWGLHLLFGLAVARGAEPPRPAVAAPKLRQTFNLKVSEFELSLVGHIYLAFSPDSRLFAYGKKGDFAIWDLHKQKEVRTLSSDYTHETYSVTFTPDSKQLVMAGARRRKPDPDRSEARFWSVATGEVVRTVDSPGSLVLHLTFSPDGKHFATGDQNGCVKVWETATGKQLRTYRDLGKNVYMVGYNAAGKSCAVVQGEETWGFFDLEGQKRIATLGSRGDPVEAELSRDGKLLATAHRNDGKAHIWDTTTGKCLATWEVDKRSHAGVERICFVPGKEHLIVCQSNKVWAWDPHAKRPFWTLDPLKDFPKRALPYWIRDIRVSPDGKWLAIYSYNGDDRWFDLWELVPARP
jgi:WD40 repeat protein